MGKLNIFHPNSKGTGACLRVLQRSARGEVTFSIYPQNRPGGMEAPGFSTEEDVTFIADWCDLSKMLMVFRGECESLGDGSGISYPHSTGWSRLMLRHMIEPVHCYVMEVYEKRDGIENHGIFNLSPAEALGLSMIIEGVLHHTLVGGEP